MSKVALTGNNSGTGTFTIAAPNSNTDRTFDLPDEAGTVLTSAGVPASAMPAGSVIQVVYSQASSISFQTSTTTYADLPGMSVNITPISPDSQVLIIAHWHVYTEAQDDGYGAGGTRLLRNSTVLFSDEDYYGVALNSDNARGRMMSYGSNSFLDSPNSTTSITYKLQGASLRETTRAIVFNGSAFSQRPGITAMEIAG